MALISNWKLDFVALLVLGMWASQTTSRDLNEASMVQKHEYWMARFGRVYRDDAETAKRFKIFKDNVDYIESVNKAVIRPYKLGINEFADLTNEEFRATHNGYKMSSHQKSSNTISFSSDMICDGGLMDDAFTFIIKNHGLTTKSNYPYEAIDGTCKTRQESNHVFKITGYEDVPANSESALLSVVSNQLVSVAIDASGSDFQFYSSGVFIGECGTELDHGITAIGYGKTSDGTKYWLVKNSWGTSWERTAILECKEALMLQREFVELLCKLLTQLLK
ncbi:vignain [Nicotiana attenuata]|uniref:Vignain n=1 Tax=Nicotiana attenuata TaxID=49451 RepID=A0A1J6J5U2_NICAT|nr:vignain [Nicotiana attenuata]